MRPTRCNLCGTMKAGALSRCPCAAGRAPGPPAMRPALAAAARVMFDVDDVDPRDGERDALINRRPALVTAVAMVGLYAWRKSGGGWPESENGQILIICGVAAVVIGLANLAFGPERVMASLERVKGLEVSVWSAPLVIGLLLLAGMLMAPTR